MPDSLLLVDAEFKAPECLTCGACCFSVATNYVPVSGADYSRLGVNSERWITWQNNRAFMRMTGGHCAALTLQAGPAGPQFFCSIYDRRPQSCRDLARGSPQCHADCTTKAPLGKKTSCL